MPSLELIAALAFALLATSIMVWRLRAELSASAFAATTAFLGTAVVAAYAGLVLIKGVSPTAFFAIVGTAYAVPTIATLGHPGVLYREWLGEATMPRRQKVLLYVRLIIAALLIAFLVTPLLQDFGYQ